MQSFESKVTRISDAEAPRFRVEFIGDRGQSVTVECLAPDAGDDEPTRDTILAQARRLAGEVADADGAARPPIAPATTYASPAGGLSRAHDETEARTHSSDGRDRGTE